MTCDIIPSAKPYFPPSDIEELKQHLSTILTSGRLTLGNYTRDFENQFAKLVGVRYAIAVNSGTSALEIMLRAHGLKGADEVIVPTNTFSATAAAVIYARGKPVITDISPSTMTLDASKVRKAITRHTRGVIVVHIGGLICPEISSIYEICQDRDLFLLEDAAHAHGSRIKGKSAGSLGSAGCFSFYPTKIVTSGEGGMITTDNEELAETAKILRDQGKEDFSSNRVVSLGYNWRMPEICAAIGLVQLRRLPEFIQNRNSIARVYDAFLDELGIDHIVTPENQLNNYYKYTFFLPKKTDRDMFKERCRTLGVIFGGEVYWPPLHLQPVFGSFLSNVSKFEVADDLCSRMVNPPIFSQMTMEQAQRVCEVARSVMSDLGS